MLNLRLFNKASNEPIRMAFTHILIHKDPSIIFILDDKYASMPHMGLKD